MKSSHQAPSRPMQQHHRNQQPAAANLSSFSIENILSSSSQPYDSTRAQQASSSSLLSQQQQQQAAAMLMLNQSLAPGHATAPAPPPPSSIAAAADIIKQNYAALLNDQLALLTSCSNPAALAAAAAAQQHLQWQQQQEQLMAAAAAAATAAAAAAANQRQQQQAQQLVSSLVSQGPSTSSHQQQNHLLSCFMTSMLLQHQQQQQLQQLQLHKKAPNSSPSPNQRARPSEHLLAGRPREQCEAPTAAACSLGEHSRASRAQQRIGPEPSSKTRRVSNKEHEEDVLDVGGSESLGGTALNSLTNFVSTLAPEYGDNTPKRPSKAYQFKSLDSPPSSSSSSTSSTAGLGPISKSKEHSQTNQNNSTSEPNKNNTENSQPKSKSGPNESTTNILDAVASALKNGAQLQQQTVAPTINATLVKAPPELVQKQPAWVFCTRYSDRPSSGPRTRRAKSKDKKAKDTKLAGEEKRPRTAFTSEQLEKLRQEFQANSYLDEKRRKALAERLCLNENQIKIWFQNKRAKMKKQSNQPNPLRGLLVAGGLYNHSTATSDCSESFVAGNGNGDEEEEDHDEDDEVRLQRAGQDDHVSKGNMGHLQEDELEGDERLQESLALGAGASLKRRQCERLADVSPMKRARTMHATGDQGNRSFVANGQEQPDGQIGERVISVS